MPVLLITASKNEFENFLPNTGDLKLPGNKSWHLVTVNLDQKKHYNLEYPAAEDGPVLFIHLGMTTLIKNKLTIRNRWDLQLEPTRDDEIKLDGTTLTITNLLHSFLYTEQPLISESYYFGLPGYSKTHQPVIVFIFVDAVTPKISASITRAMGVDPFGNSRRKVYVIAIPINKSLTKSELNAEASIKASFQKLMLLLNKNPKVKDILSAFEGAEHFAQKNQFDSDDDEISEIKNSLDKALDFSVVKNLKAKNKGFVQIKALSGDYNLNTDSTEYLHDMKLNDLQPLRDNYKNIELEIGPVSSDKTDPDISDIHEIHTDDLEIKGKYQETEEHETKEEEIEADDDEGGDGGEKKIEEVNCSVYSPKKVLQGAEFLVQVFMHTESQSKNLKPLAKSADNAAAFAVSSTLDEKLKQGSKLEFQLVFTDLAVEEDKLSLTWNGKIKTAAFTVKVPPYFPATDVIGKVIVLKDSVPIGQLKFKISIITELSQSSKTKNTWSQLERFHKAFISYSSKDRPEVLKRVQMLELIRLDYFQDLLTLEAGDEWAKQIYRYLDTCDVVFLFWSRAASESKWVGQEIAYAVERRKKNKDCPAIIPVIIEGPPPVKPPEELKFLHFNDKMIYFINPGSI